MKKKIFSIGLCLTLLLSGCAQRGSVFSEATSTEATSTEATSTEATSTEATSVHQYEQTSDLSQSGETEATPIAAQQIDWSKVQGQVMGIYPAGDSKVLVFADKISLYDLATGKTVGTASEEVLDSLRCWTLDSGYVIVGQVTSKGSGGLEVVEGTSGPQLRVVFYDASLKSRSEFDILNILRDEETLMVPEAIAFSSDGNRIAYATMNGLYLYDRQQDKRTTLIDLTAEDWKARSGICNVEQVGFTNGGNSIAFKAQSFDVPVVIDKPSFDTIGIINTDGTGLTNQKVDGYAAKELSAYDSRLLVAEDFTTADGRMMVMDNKSGSKKIHILSDNNEGGNIYGSDTGRYFASSVSSKTGWTVRVYDTETGKMVKEESISNDGQELYGFNDPMLRIVDKTKTCIVLLGNKQDAVDTKIVSIAF